MSRADRLPLRRAALIVLTLLLPGLAAADQTITVVQKNRAFDQVVVTLNRGDTIKFTNQDDFDHQIYVASPGFTFESDEAAPGQDVNLRFTQSGRFAVRCHIHPKMNLEVIVK